MSNPFDEPADEELSRLVDEELTLGADVLADVDALMQATDLDELMSPADIAVLRGLLKAVQQDTSLHERLDAFIDTHCHEFVSYSASDHCEHKLEWVSCLKYQMPLVRWRLALRRSTPQTPPCMPFADRAARGVRQDDRGVCRRAAELDGPPGVGALRSAAVGARHRPARASLGVGDAARPATLRSLGSNFCVIGLRP